MKIRCVYNGNLIPVRADADRLLKKLDAGAEYDVDVHVPDARSPKENRTYWAVMAWAEANTPELYEKVLGRVHANTWHTIFKDKYKKTSTAFSNMGEGEFNRYFTAVLDDLLLITGCDPTEENRISLVDEASKYKSKRDTV